MFRKTAFVAALFVVSATIFFLRVRMELVEQSRLHPEAMGEALREPSVMLRILGIASIALMAAAICFFAKDWYRYCRHHSQLRALNAGKHLKRHA